MALVSRALVDRTAAAAAAADAAAFFVQVAAATKDTMLFICTEHNERCNTACLTFVCSALNTLWSEM